MPGTVLIVDSDQPIRRASAAMLRHSGYATETASSAKQAFSVLRRRPPSAVVVDPAIGGATNLIEELRIRTDVPIIVVSHRVEEGDKVAALDAGADDYLAKPFGSNELLARLRAALRRSAARDEPVVETPHFTVDLGAKRVRLSGGEEVSLTPTEWRIVEALIRRQGKVVVHPQLLAQIWGSSARTKTNYLRVYMAAIRRKLEPYPPHPRYFITYSGLGHMFIAG